MEKQINKEAKQGWRFAADAARITDVSVSSEPCKHTSGGVSVAIDSDLGRAIDKKEELVRPSLGMKEESPKHG